MALLVGERPAKAAQHTAARPRLDGLDVLRGAAVGAVLLGHSWPGIFQGAGIVGVIAFFVLSGYLITNVLVRDIERHRKIRYGRFYAHRAFRLVPALISLLGVYAIVELATDVLGDRSKGIVGYTVLAGLGLPQRPAPAVRRQHGDRTALDAGGGRTVLPDLACAARARPAAQPSGPAHWLVRRRRPVPHGGKCAGNDDPGPATALTGLRAAHNVGPGTDRRFGPAAVQGPCVQLVHRPPAQACGDARIRRRPGRR